MGLPLVLALLHSLTWYTDAVIVHKRVNIESATPSSNIYPPKPNFAHGYNVKATSEACKDAAKVLGRKIDENLKVEKIGNCQSHVVKYPENPKKWFQISHRRRYLSECPTVPPFFLKNVGSDEWSIYF